MKTKILFFLMLIVLGNCSLVVKGQDYFKYYQLVEEASQLYDSNEYLKSGQKYSEAFIALENKGMMEDRYNAACSWALNLIKIEEILGKYGWLGADIVGEKGNQTIFLVIQHSDLATQEKYLPMMREAVKNGKALASDLALLEDRVALRKGKKQIYGSQIGTDPETQQNYVMRLKDPDNVDKRRAEVGLPPMAEYLSYFNLKWDVEQYKKDLPSIEAREKESHK